jgi:hypothetical protein
MVYDLNQFAAQVFAPIVIILGAIGNLLGMIVISQKKLKEMGPQKIFICMFALDCIYFPLIFHPYMAYMFATNVTNMSSVACKLYWYARYSMAFISPMMNVYVSVERFISITFPSKKLFLQKKSSQHIFIAMISVANVLLAVDVALYFDIVYVNISSTNHTTIQIYYCDFVDIYWQDVSGYIDLISRVIVPAGLMIIFSFLIAGSIFRSRDRIARISNTAANHANNATLRKDIRFAVVCVGLNLFYILFSLPVSIVVLMPNYADNQFYIITSFLFFLAYSSNFYLMISFNRLFRRVFFQKFFHFLHKEGHTNTGVMAKRGQATKVPRGHTDAPELNKKKQRH